MDKDTKSMLLYYIIYIKNFSGIVDCKNILFIYVLLVRIVFNNTRTSTEVPT